MRHLNWSAAFAIPASVAVVATLVLFVTDPSWVMGLIMLIALSGLTLVARSIYTDRQVRRQAPREPEAMSLYAELEQLIEVWRDRTVRSWKHGGVALYCSGDSPGVVTRMDPPALDDDEAGVMIGERLVLTPFQPIVLRVVQGHSYVVGRDDRVHLLDEQGKRPKVSPRSVMWMLRTGAGVLSTDEMRELAEQLRAAEPLKR